MIDKSNNANTDTAAAEELMAVPTKDSILMEM